MNLDVIAADIDFLVFSAHKMFGPMGIGVLYARSDLLQDMQPFLYGGSMVKKLAKPNVWSDLPQKFEAGTPNVPGVVGLAAAIDFLDAQDWTDLIAYENLLIAEFLKHLKERAYLRLLGPLEGQGRVSVFSLVMDGVHAHDVADFLGNQGICVRAGHHCAQPLMARFQVPASFRASLTYYNSIDEIQKFFLVLDQCYSFFKQF
jgi:cysteine desulfurase/selenocysteine lyase